MPRSKPKTVAEYIKAAPPHTRKSLREMRALLKKAAPHATEKLKWGAPVFESKRILFAFAAFRNHMNFMPTGPAMKLFKKELARFVTGKDSIQFTYDKPLPKTLIRKIAAFRVKQVREEDARWMY